MSLSEEIHLLQVLHDYQRTVYSSSKLYITSFRHRGVEMGVSNATKPTPQTAEAGH